MGCVQTKESHATKGRELKTVGKSQRSFQALRLISKEKKKSDEDGAWNAQEGPIVLIEGRLSERDVRKRTTTSPSTKSFVIDRQKNVAIRYAYVTQRGFYPDDYDKPNQDAYSVAMELGGMDTDALLAVYDGHGAHGHECAQFAMAELPKLIANNIRLTRAEARMKALSAVNRNDAESCNPSSDWPKLTPEQVQHACKSAHIECNEMMHQKLEAFDKLSGTTAISALFHNGFLTVSNVGDSRAVLGQTAFGKIELGEAKRERERVPEIAEDVDCDFDDSQDVAEQNSERQLSVDRSNEQSLPCASDTHHSNADVAAGGGGGGSSLERQKQDDPATATAAILLASSEQIKRKPVKSKQSLTVLPLSYDQTPYRRDERERVKIAGARVLSIDQIEGIEPIHENWKEIDLGEDIDEEGDPPRVWSPGGNYPGTAFTRSIGDAIADEIGVHAEPEMISLELTNNDKIIVLASDGIFEFLTNKDVIDICSVHCDPLEASLEVMAKAHEKWVEYELRTDDMTMICVFVDWPGDDKHALCELNTFAVSAMEQDEAANLVEARSSISHCNAATQADKLPQDREIILRVLAVTTAFQNLTDDQRNSFIDFMNAVDVKNGDVIYKQGDDADYFYIVAQGTFALEVSDDDSSSSSQIRQFEGDSDVAFAPSFGEGALIHHRGKRAGTVVAKTGGRLWALHKSVYTEIRPKMTFNRALFYELKKMTETLNLSSSQLWKVVNSADRVHFAAKEAIIKKGDIVDAFYIIKHGRCERTVSAEKYTTLLEGDYFGEAVFLDDQSISNATIVAITDATFLKLPRGVARRFSKKVHFS